MDKWFIGDVNIIDRNCDGILSNVDIINEGEDRVCSVNTYKQPIAQHIIKCVNEHDNLIEEIERLKQENKTEFERYQKRLAVRDKEIEESKLLNDTFAKEIEKLKQKLYKLEFEKCEED